MSRRGCCHRRAGKRGESGPELRKRADSVVGGYGGQEGRSWCSLVLCYASSRCCSVSPLSLLLKKITDELEHWVSFISEGDIVALTTVLQHQEKKTRLSSLHNVT